jgi:hypothetical protein
LINKKIVLLACIAWAGAAISSATPANAYAATTQSGTFAACSAANSSYVFMGCWDMSYKQIIKFGTTGCNSGACNSDQGDVYVQFLYQTGRHDTTWLEGCDGVNLYMMDSCSC